MRLPLRTRIIVAFAVSFVCFLAALALGLWELGKIGAGLQLMDEGYVPLARAATSMEGSLLRLESELTESGDEARPASSLRKNASLYQDRIASAVSSGQSAINLALELELEDSERSLLEGLDLQLQVIDEYNRQLLGLTEEWLDLAQAGRSSEARALYPELLRSRGELEIRVNQLSRQVDGRIRGLADETSEAQRAALLASGSLALVALGLGLAMLALSVIALRPIAAMTQEVERIADGDYSARVQIQSDDELGLLSMRINEMAEAIHQRDEDLRRSAEQALRDQGRLARAERLALVGQMLAQITHEVRNPLNAMSLNAELLAEELEALPLERQQEANEILATVTGEIERLEQTTEHYLTLATRPAAALVPTDPKELLESVRRLLEAELRVAQVALSLQVPEGVPVELDANQVRRALLNVVKNAVEAGAKNIQISVERRGSSLRFEVQDDGPGLSQEEAERAFDPFFTTKSSGSGLGLAITRQVMEDHGGSVELMQGSPTRILLSIPLLESQDPLGLLQ